MDQARLLELLETAQVWVVENPAIAAAAAAGAVGIPILALILVGLHRRRARRVAAAPIEAEATASAAEPQAAEPEVALEHEPIALESEPVPVEVAPEPEPESAEVVAAPAPLRLRDRLARTRSALVERLEGVLSARRVDAETLDEIEALLMSADLGVATAESLLETVRKEASGGDAERVREVLRQAVTTKLARVEPTGEAGMPETGPHVILVLGVNGSGKTTTIGKLAARFRSQGRSVILGAGDTFRAAATQQLQIWGERVGCDVVTGRPGGDPSAVAFDTLKAAVARGCDVALIDTAGRLQTREPLVEELRKIVRVIGRELPGAPHETLLVLDANTGQNAIHQARIFTEAAGVSALAVTKLDGTARGGVLVGLADELGIPVHYVGVGEGVEDLRDFSASEFVDALFATGEEA
jgi:fused signal recognition particle receptor